MDDSIRSGNLRLSAHFAVPPAPARGLGLVICHGLPNPPRGAATVGTTYPDLADRIAAEAGWIALTFNFRGTGTSEGDFSARGWIDDIRAAVRVLDARDDVRAVWTVGFGHGGTFAVCEAADDDLVRGVASFAAPTTLRDWARDPGQLLVHTRSMGMIRTPGYPTDATTWVRDVGRLDAAAAAARLGDRPLLVMHGNEDAEVPASEARALAEAAPAAELRMVNGAGHRLRHDPRAIATLLGWLDRQAADPAVVPPAVPPALVSVAGAGLGQDVAEGGVEPDRGTPAGGVDEPPAVADEDGDLDRPDQLGVDTERDRARREAEQANREILDADPHT
jgi:putative redox protein